MTATLPEKGSDRALYLIDVSSFIFRAYYSVGYLSTSDGTPTGAVFGVANMFLKLLDDYAPTHIVAAMDSKTPTFRKEIYPEYKANRPPPPDDLKVQFPLVEELIEGFNMAVLQKDGFEADDVMATAAAVARRAGFDVVIVSGDKDMMQLVEPGVVMLDTMKDMVWDSEAVEKKWGVPPSLLGDLLALAGDSSDNIPGVPRVGPKTAAPLLVEYGGLDALLEGRDSLKSKALAKRLTEHEEDARLSRRLVTLNDQVPLEMNMEGMRYGEPDLKRLAAVLDRFEFRKLRERLVGVDETEFEQVSVDYRTVTTEKELTEIASAIRDKGLFAVDLETTSVDAARAEIVGVALAWELDSAVYVPVAHQDGPSLPLETVLGIVGPLLTSPEIGVIAQNVKYEDTIFRRHDIIMKNIAFDPMLASYLLRVDGRSHSLDVLARELLGRKMISYNEVTEKSRGHQLTFDAVSVEKATEYSGEDALMALAVADKMGPMVKEADAEKLLFDMEIPLARVLTGVELAGVALDTKLLEEMSRSFGGELETLEAEAHQLAGHGFNLASPKQLQEILFGELGLPTQRKTKTGYSTDSEVLEVLSTKHALPALLLEHRVLSKLKGTYLDALPKLVNPATRRIHTSFNQAVTATGRLSSSNPNLQNIPIRSKRGRDIRRAFIAAPGHALVSADYSQVELRVLAHLSGDPELTGAFSRGDDIHTRTARAIFGYGPDEEVPSRERAQAKTVNFGVIYGKTAFSLAKELHIPRSEATRFIDEYFHLYGGVQRFMDETIERASKEQSVSTLLGRRRELRDIQASNHIIRKQAERMARNTPIQGTAADLLKVAMIRVDRRIADEGIGARMILTVHDELVFEVPESEVNEAKAMIREEMEGALELSVPLVVDVGVGSNWAEAH
ncbi:MAG: DNA polymerase I [Deltaproteobacteria bacterium]|nr:DNA polymerase I [Deltaproteobacteria bacterium]